MRQDWFKLVDGKAALPWREWEACLRDTEDLQASMRLGTRAFRAVQGAKVSEVKRSDEKTIEAFAHLLHHGFDEVDKRTLDHLVRSFEGREGTVEPRFWEAPAHRLNSFRTLLGRQNAKLGPLFLFVALEDELDQNLRLNLLRLSWVCHLGAGERSPYVKAQMDERGRAWPLSHAMERIEALRSQGKPEFLDKGESGALERLLGDVRGLGAPELAPDEVLAMVGAADLGTDAEGDLVVFWPLRKETIIPKKRLRAWYEDAFRNGSLLIAFKVMLLAHVAGRYGGLRPEGLMLGD